MRSLGEQLRAAGRHLGIQVTAPYDVRVGGQRLDVDAILPQFGAPRGMLVAAANVFAASHEELVALGYGYSVLDPEPSGNIDPEDLKAVLRDWGWSADTPAPVWLRE